MSGGMSAAEIRARVLSSWRCSTAGVFEPRISGRVVVLTKAGRGCGCALVRWCAAEQSFEKSS